jgi:NAD(P)H-flavin reductase
MNMTNQKFDFPTELIPELLSKFYGESGFWEKHSEKCLACGSCVLVCPTCYCFDVKEQADLSLEYGERIRTWDGCLLEDFAKIASGENFRPTRPTRYRHRYFKKGKYLFDRFGFISCVGCGRCSSNCLPDIANPVNLFNDMYHETRSMGVQVAPATEPEVDIQTEGSIDYVPKLATIVKKVPMTAKEILFEIKLDDGSDINHKPGQFVEVSVFGIGEAPISVSSSPTKKGTFELCVRKVGNVTTKLHTLNVGDKVGVRGPFGNGFDAELLKGKDLLFVSGGLGIAPLRSLFNYVLDKRKDYGRVILLYGCKEPRELLFGDELLALAKRADVEFKPTVDWCPENEVWDGNIGVITTLIPQVNFDPENTYAIVCGPPIMYKFVIADLKGRKVPDDHIIISLERRMKCGVGKCGHCQINQIYVCKDGPVFIYSKIKGVPEAL